MRLGKYLSKMTKPELEELKDQLNLTDDEENVFNLLKRGNSREQIAQKLSISTATVGNRVNDISHKVKKISAMAGVGFERT